MSKRIPRLLKIAHQLTMKIIHFTEIDSGSKSQNYTVNK